MSSTKLHLKRHTNAFTAEQIQMNWPWCSDIFGGGLSLLHLPVYCCYRKQICKVKQPSVCLKVLNLYLCVHAEATAARVTLFTLSPKRCCTQLGNYNLFAKLGAEVYFLNDGYTFSCKGYQITLFTQRSAWFCFFKKLPNTLCNLTNVHIKTKTYRLWLVSPPYGRLCTQKNLLPPCPWFAPQIAPGSEAGNRFSSDPCPSPGSRLCHGSQTAYPSEHFTDERTKPTIKLC